jgi:hypothetical protein
MNVMKEGLSIYIRATREISQAAHTIDERTPGNMTILRRQDQQLLHVRLYCHLPAV